VNKSGLYAKFEDKEDLFVQSLRYYLENLQKKGLLTAEPLGWDNIERFLKMGPCSLQGQKACFAISSMREVAILPPEAVGIMTRSRSKLKYLIAKNIEVERPKMNAELILTFFTGLSMEHKLSSRHAAIVRKIDGGRSSGARCGCVIRARLLARSETTLPRRRRPRWLARRAHRPVRDVRR
jgi:TetR/AcrR family transcriptional regulator, copper-responsive repressor